MFERQTSDLAQPVNNTIIVYGSLQTQFWRNKISIQGTHFTNTN